MSTRQETVEAKSGAYNAMSKDWPLIDSVTGGTKAVRSFGQAFLPQHTHESDDNYKKRLETAVLTPFFKLTTVFYQGRVFAKPLKMNENMPEEIKEWSKDIDLTGRDINAFCQEMFIKSLSYGMGFLLVDNSERVQEARTKDEAIKLGVRPYFVFVPVQNVISCVLSSDGKTVEYARIVEVSVEYDPNTFKEQTVKRIRSFSPNKWELWKEVSSGKTSEEWVLERSGERSLREVPLIPYFTNRTGKMQAESPLLDLAYMNISHYQARSNHQNAITVAQFPILAATGYTSQRGSESDGLIIGPRKALISSDPGAKFYYVEHTGAAIASGRQYLEDLKAEMAMHGISLLIPKGVGSAETTATEERNRQEDTETPLAVMADALCDVLDLAFYYLGVLGGVGDNVKAECSLEGSFNLTSKDATDVANLMGMRASNEITRGTFYAELKRRGFLAESFDAEAEEEKLLSEAPESDFDEDETVPGKKPEMKTDEAEQENNAGVE